MRAAIATVAVLLLGSAGVVRHTQAPLSARLHKIKQQNDIYIFPPQRELNILSLGYKNALADLLWAKLLIEYGTHWAEHTEFTQGPNYLDAILSLDPEHPLVYVYADTLLCYRPLHGTEEDARKARTFLERATQARPWDYNVWVHYGQFLAFIALSFLTDEHEKDQWEKEGALALVHAVQLGARASLSISAATLLGRSGETAAAIQQLERSYFVTEDPRVREEIASKLLRLRADAQLETAHAAVNVVETARKAEWSFLSPTMYLLLGPMREPARCAGLGKDGADCPADWVTAFAQLEP